MQPNESESVATKAGLNFLPPVAERARSAFSGARQCWGQLLNDPQFTGLDAFQDAVDQLENIEERVVGYKFGDAWVETDRVKALVGTRSQKLYSVASNVYVPVQDGEVAAPMLTAARDYQLHPVGRIDAGNGRTRGHILLSNPDFKIRLLEDYPEDIMLGIRWWNSFTQDTSFGAELFGVRMVCVNYNLWGELLGQFRVTHRIEASQMVAQYEALLKKALNASTILSDVIAKARNLVVVEADVPDLLWGISLPKTGVDAITAGPTLYAPEIKTLGLNAWTLYNAATPFITYRPSGRRHVNSTQHHAR